MQLTCTIRVDYDLIFCVGLSGAGGPRNVDLGGMGELIVSDLDREGGSLNVLLGRGDHIDCVGSLLLGRERCDACT